MTLVRKKSGEQIQIVLGIQWGDEGKGKIVDYLAQKIDVVVRFSGGPNAGHTIVNNKGTFKLHLIPSGICNPRTLNILTSGVVINPFSMVKEIEELREKGITVNESNLLVSSYAHLILPWHRMRDSYSEIARGGQKIGTTGQGIGPAYSDRAARVGLRMGDLIRQDFKKHFEKEFMFQEKLVSLTSGENKKHMNKEEILLDLEKVRKILRPFITNVEPVMWKAYAKGKTILAEGAQGALLDLDLGMYPYVTSSNTGLAGFYKSTGLYDEDTIIGVVKAYSTRVGGGPMVTELNDATGKYIQQKGHEVGTTTGRTRRVGWFDVPATRFGARKVAGISPHHNGIIALTKLDVLDELKEIKICIAYEVEGVQYKELPTLDSEFIIKAKPVYITVKGWQKESTKAKTFGELPKNAQNYIVRIEKLMGIPITMISVGADRDATIHRTIIQKRK